MKLFAIGTLIALFFFISAHSQIISPDTVCVNTPVNFYSEQQNTSYTWMVDTVNTNQTPANLQQITTGSALGTPAYATFNYDNGNFYSFVTNSAGVTVTRLSYGSSPTNTPAILNLGSFGLTFSAGGNLEGIDIVKDTVANAWYGLVVNDDQLVFLNFGTSLANIPTANIMTFSGVLTYAHQITIKKYNSGWLAFVANRDGSMSRFDFGTSLANTPTAVNLPNAGGINSPCNFAIHEQGGNWYMLVNSLIDGTLTRLEFGANLQNDTPSGVPLGDPGGFYFIPRPISLITNCDGDLFAYVMDEDGLLIKLDFNGDITSMPVATSMGNIGTSAVNAYLPYIYGNELYYLVTSWGNNALYTYNMMSLPSPAATFYYNPNYTYTFTSPGVYNITLFNDQSYQSDAFSFCKQVVVLNGGNAVSVTDTAMCQGNAITLHSGELGSQTWNTGATADSIVASQGGAYWVTATNICGASSDTFHVQAVPIPLVDIGNDTSICAGYAVTLESAYQYAALATYLWNTGSTGPSIQASQPGVYWLDITISGCTGADTVQLDITQPPIVQLGNDTSICQGNTVTLASTQPPGATYTWSTGSTGNSIPVSQSGTYWLAVSDSGCTTGDTIHVVVNPIPQVTLGNDASICAGQSITLGNLNNFNNATYTWSTGASSATIQASQADTYWLAVDENGCIGSDTVAITVNPVPAVALGSDTTICAGTAITLLPTVQPADNPVYTWNTGSNDPSITVSESGNYWVAVSEKGCTGSDSELVTQIQPPSLNFGGDTTVCLNVLLTLSAGYNIDGTIVWNDGSTGNTYNVTKDGVYYATETNQCGSATDSITVNYEYCDLWFPSAFTPNNDGHNDIIRALGGLSKLGDFKLAIFNRWGQMVFETYDRYSGWDGKYNGVPQPIDTYDYMIQYSFNEAGGLTNGETNGPTYVMKGSFELVR